jgi:hypothetical protein
VKRGIKLMILMISLLFIFGCSNTDYSEVPYEGDETGSEIEEEESIGEDIYYEIYVYQGTMDLLEMEGYVGDTIHLTVTADSSEDTTYTFYQSGYGESGTVTWATAYETSFELDASGSYYYDLSSLDFDTETGYLTVYS